VPQPTRPALVLARPASEPTPPAALPTPSTVPPTPTAVLPTLTAVPPTPLAVLATLPAGEDSGDEPRRTTRWPRAALVGLLVATGALAMAPEPWRSELLARVTESFSAMRASLAPIARTEPAAVPAMAPNAAEPAPADQGAKVPVDQPSAFAPEHAASSADASSALVRARRAIVAPRPEFPRSATLSGVNAGHVTAALDIGPDGRVLTVAVLASEPAGVFDSEVIRTLQRWQYEPTGSVARSTIDIVFKADAP